MGIFEGRRVVVLDTETTDLDPYNRLAWDIAGVVVEPDGSSRTFQYFVELTEREIERANQESLEVGMFDERYNQYEAMSKRAVAAALADLTKDAVLAGFTIDFDMEVIRNLMHQFGFTPEWDYHLFDVGTYLAGYLRHEPKLTDWKPRQSELGDYYGVTANSAEHTALGDAEYCESIMRAAGLFDE